MAETSVKELENYQSGVWAARHAAQTIVSHGNSSCLGERQEKHTNEGRGLRNW